jgi:Ser/Thr protein kinase RdoA (MazF antagonist)
MMTNDPTPRFDALTAAQIADEVFGITGAAHPLPSERDQNFALTTERTEHYVLKFANSEEDRDVLEFQNAALEHVSNHSPQLAIPRLVRGRNGINMAIAHDGGGRQFLVRLMTWVPGETYVTTTSHSEVLLASLGTRLAELDAALQSFQHRAMHRSLHWDLKHFLLSLKHLPLLPPARRDIVQQLSRSWFKIPWPALRASVIHGDPNNDNVLVRDGRVAGFLDFGDLVHSAVVCDLALATAYAMLDQHNAIATAAHIARAYTKVYPLTEPEVEALYPLILSRLCMSVCYSAHNAIAKSGDAYQMVTAAPAWVLLERLAGVPLETVTAQLSRACRP